MSQQTLFQFVGKRKKPDDVSECENEILAKKAKKERNSWNDAWNRTFPWLEKSTNKDGSVSALCTWCKDSKRTNSMATTGTPNLQSSTFSRHEKTKDHLLAAEARQHKKQNKMIKQVIF
jgi:hypothetical protein